MRDSEASVVAGVYVFAVHTCKQPEAYDPLDLGSWEFYVVSGEVIRDLNQRSMALSTLQRIAGEPVAWNALYETVRLVTASKSL
jgi:hypothetical protein